MKDNQPISDLFDSRKALLSVEFFPPKDEIGGERILRAAEAIRTAVKPDFVSITYGAGGTTRERTLRYASILKDEYDFEVMPHLTCVGSSREEIHEIVEGYRKLGFINLMALRGDPPRGEETFRPHPDGFPYACDLVAYLRQEFPEISLGVAGYPEVHPEALSAEKDLIYLSEKVDAGASFVTTQLFYDNQSYFDFVAKARTAGIHVPILPGLMPIRSAVQARRFCNQIPEELDELLEKAGEDTKAIHQVGVDWAFRQTVELLKAGAPGVHFYIMNRSSMTIELVDRLRGSGFFQP